MFIHINTGVGDVLVQGGTTGRQTQSSKRVFLALCLIAAQEMHYPCPFCVFSICKSHAAEHVDTSVGGQIIVLALLSRLSLQFHFIKLQIAR